MMKSDRRTDSARANGAKSRGPITPEGKARSAQNAIRHGLLAKFQVLTMESLSGFEEMLCEHEARFAPRDAVDDHYLHEMVSATWRMRRAWAIENTLWNQALANEPPGDSLERLANAFSKLAATPEFSLLQRYETRLHNSYQRALKTLLLVRKVCLPNEPNPENEHLPHPPDEPVSPAPEADPPPPPPPPSPEPSASGPALPDGAESTLPNSPNSPDSAPEPSAGSPPAAPPPAPGKIFEMFKLPPFEESGG